MSRVVVRAKPRSCRQASAPSSRRSLCPGSLKPLRLYVCIARSGGQGGIVGAKGYVVRRLAFWLAAIGILGALGMHVERDLTSRPGITVSGTEAARAEALEHKHFGTSSTLIVLLEGPRAERLHQARLVAQRFTRDRRIAVLGPWSPGAGRALAPGRNRTMLLARLDAGDQVAAQEIVPRLRRTLDESTSGPVRSYLTGFADIGSGMTRETMSA